MDRYREAIPMVPRASGAKMTINRQTNDYSQRYGVKRKRTREANGREKRKGKKNKVPKKGRKKSK